MNETLGRDESIAVTITLRSRGKHLAGVIVTDRRTVIRDSGFKRKIFKKNTDGVGGGLFLMIMQMLLNGSHLHPF